MATKSKLLQAAAGSAGGGAGGPNIEQVFSTHIYDGDGTTSKTITNDIALGNGYDSYILLLDGESDLSPTNASMTDFNSDIGTASTTPWDGATALDFTSGSDTSTLRIDTNIFSSFSNTSPFTIEAWVYFTSQPSVKAIFGLNHRTSGNNLFVALTGYSGGTTVLYPSGDHNFESISTYPLNTWIHYAFVYTGSKVRMYKDGVLMGEDTKTLDTPNNSYLFIGNESDSTAGQGSGNLFPGYIADVRVSNHARYNSNFTPPSSNEGDGGLVWIKQRNTSQNHVLTDTARGAGYRLDTSTNNTPDYDIARLKSFNSNGFTVGDNTTVNNSTGTYASWSWKKAEKWFDIVTWTGNGVAGREIAHSLGSVPGMIILKSTNTAIAWQCYHRSLGATKQVAFSQQNVPSTSTNAWNDTSPTDTHFTVGTGNNTLNRTYVAYIFAHHDDDGGFGPNADMDAIKCGTYTTDGSENATIDLGFEPQWLLVKRIDGAGGAASYDWRIIDNMREWDVEGDVSYLATNQQTAEADFDGRYFITSSGFKQGALGANREYIYMAIRRGPMAVPDDANDVFEALAYTGNGSADRNIGNITVDTNLVMDRTNTSDLNNYHTIFDRLRGEDDALKPNGALAASDGWATSYYNLDHQHGFSNGSNTTYFNKSSASYISYTWRRAPHYFDTVVYNGNSTARNISHALGVTPEMIWVKQTTGQKEWFVHHKDLTSGKVLQLESTTAETNGDYGSITDTTFGVTTSANLNASGHQYIAYLFASLDNVSKVGSFTHTNGTATNVDCGFSNGARFVLLKYYDQISDWWVFDTERGIAAGNDARKIMNNVNAETSTDQIDPYSAGFTYDSARASGDIIFYAIA